MSPIAVAELARVPVLAFLDNGVFVILSTTGRDRQGKRIGRCTMANKTGVTWLTEEVAEFLASSPSPEELLAFRPSARAIQRYSALLARSKTGLLSTEEQWELDQFEHIEMLVQSIKARLRPAKPVRV